MQTFADFRDDVFRELPQRTSWAGGRHSTATLATKHSSCERRRRCASYWPVVQCHGAHA